MLMKSEQKMILAGLFNLSAIFALLVIGATLISNL